MIAALNLIRQQARAGWRYRWMALALAWAICGMGWLKVYTMPDSYEASARLYVDTDAVLTPLLKGLALDNTPLNQIDMLQKTLLSRPNLEKLISKTSLDLVATTPFDRDQLIEQLSKGIKIESQNQNLFSIVYRNTSPQMAQSVVRTLLAIFMEKATGSSRSDTENAQQFIDQQIALYEQRLREAEKRRADFQSKYIEVLSVNGGASRLEVARTQVRTLSGDLQDAIARRDMLARDLQSTTPVLSTDPDAPGFGGNSPLAQAEHQLQELRLRYTEKDPDVVEARQRVEMLRRVAGASGAGGHARAIANPVYEQLKLRLVDAEATVASLQRRLRDMTAERDRLEAIRRGEPGLEAEATNLNRDYDVLRKAYQELVTRREAMRLGSAADRDADKVKMSIVDPPELPRVPVAPNRPLLFSGVLLVGLGSGIALAFLLVQLDQSFATIQNLRSLGRPVIGGVSLRQPPPLKGRAVSVLVFACGVMLLVAVFGGLVAGVHGFAKVI